MSPRLRNGLLSGWIAALCLLLLVGCNQGREQLVADLQSTRPEVRAHAIHELSLQNRSEDLIIFTQAAKDLSPLVRKEAAEALGKSGDPRVVDLLGDLLADPDPSVQAEAASALAAFHGTKAKGYLLLQYARRGRSTREAIVSALKATSVPHPMVAAVEAESKAIWSRNMRAFDDGDLAEQVAAAEEIGKSGRPEAISKLKSLVARGPVLLTAAALRGLAHADAKEQIPLILKALARSSPELREAAIEALRAFGDPAALQPLTGVALEKSAASTAATRAMAALPRSKDVDAALCRVVAEGGADSAQVAANAMARRGGCPIPPLLASLPTGRAAARQPSATTRPRILGALGALRLLARSDPKVTARIVPLLRNPDPAVRARAFGVLAALGDHTTAPDVLQAFDAERSRIEALRADWDPEHLPEQFMPGFGGTSRSPDEDPDSTARAVQQKALFQKVRRLQSKRIQASGKIASHPRAPKELVRDVAEEDLRPLAEGLRAVAATGCDGAQKILEGFADDASPSVRAAALAGLVRLGKGTLARGAEGLWDPDHDVRVSVADALEAEGADGRRALVAALGKSASESLFMLEALAGDERALPDPDAVPVLVPLLQGGATQSALAADLLGRMKAEAAVKPLLAVLGDPTAAAHREAIRALGRIGDPAAIPSLIGELYDESPDIRAAAADALGALHATAAIAPLRALEKDYYLRVRTAAAKALADLHARASGATE